MTADAAAPQRSSRTIFRLAIPVGIVAGGLLLFPVIAGGTIDPCEASVRLALQKNLISTADFGPVGQYLAIKLGTEAIRIDHGTFGCYRTLERVIRMDRGPQAAR